MSDICLTNAIMSDMDKRITIRLTEDEYEKLQSITGKNVSDKVKSLIGGKIAADCSAVKKEECAVCIKKDFDIQLVELLERVMKSKEDSDAKRVIYNALKEYSAVFKKLDKMVYSYDELIDAFGLNRLDKNVQSRGFLDKIEIRLYE